MKRWKYNINFTASHKSISRIRWDKINLGHKINLPLLWKDSLSLSFKASCYINILEMSLILKSCQYFSQVIWKKKTLKNPFKDCLLRSKQYLAHTRYSTNTCLLNGVYTCTCKFWYNICILSYTDAEKLTNPEEGGNFMFGILPDFVLCVFSYGWF